jgi:DNA-binding NarL/FixJ family response regulator
VTGGLEPAGIDRGETLLVDDHPLFRLGFAAAWRRERPQDRLAEAVSLGEAKGLMRSSLRLVVLDLMLPDGLGFDLLPIARLHSVPVVFLSTVDAPAVVSTARRLGAVGYLSKELDPRIILLELERLFGDRRARVFPEHRAVPSLTVRERDVLRGLLAGQGNREIADALGVGAETVKTHVASLLTRLGAIDRFDATHIARHLGLDVVLPYLGEDGLPGSP